MKEVPQQAIEWKSLFNPSMDNFMSFFLSSIFLLCSLISSIVLISCCITAVCMKASDIPKVIQSGTQNFFYLWAEDSYLDWPSLPWFHHWEWWWNRKLIRKGGHDSDCILTVIPSSIWCWGKIFLVTTSKCPTVFPVSDLFLLLFAHSSSSISCLWQYGLVFLKLKLEFGL